MEYQYFENLKHMRARAHYLEDTSEMEDSPKVEEKITFKCPECGKELERSHGGNRGGKKYFCNNEDCEDVFIRNLHNDKALQIARSAIM
jgi:predicted RNA-binding Zn-ribbon protein involved in translation (DUF1610 family)